MSAYHFLLAHVFGFFGFWKKNTNNLRVGIFHDVAQEHQARFAAQLEQIASIGEIISPIEFENHFSGIGKAFGNKTMLTFDDGFESNFLIAQEVLNPRNIKAVFFIVPQFVDTIPGLAQDEFVQRNIYPRSGKRDIPKNLRSMTWPQIKLLSSQGHTIGCHTYTHARLSQIDNDDLLKHEVIDSGDRIYAATGIHVEHFAYTFGDLGSFSRAGLKIATQRYKYVYSGLRGSNDLGVSPFAIRRDAIGPTDSAKFVRAVLHGAADFQYKRSVKELDVWVKELDV